ncbi:GNAT family N-acetyltransferase [Legionella sp. W05-934-2]|uniref:GNAT family N-acetyltransferase n=1 Tax=Legionella sp. W05-934-2 TaxID=1198649 RepID=UPI0034622223
MKKSFDAELSKESKKLTKAVELMYVYVDEKVRGLGFGHQIVNQAKLVAQESAAQLIYFDTLKQSLNKFYEKQGAKVVCEGRLFSEPTDVFRMSV